MIIKSVAASLPSRVVTNDDMIEMIREQSPAFRGDIDKTLRKIHALLKISGLRERRWCDRHETPIDHIAKATRAALEETYLQKKHIELLIYVGVGRGFIEPGNAHMVANTLGFHNAECFDVVDACMSWIRALQLVDSLFKTGKYKNALVINAEFNITGNNNSGLFSMDADDQVDYTFPIFTIGESATATLLSSRDQDNFKFFFRHNLTNQTFAPSH